MKWSVSKKKGNDREVGRKRESELVGMDRDLNRRVEGKRTGKTSF